MTWVKSYIYVLVLFLLLSASAFTAGAGGAGAEENPTNVVFSLSVTNQMLETTLKEIGELIGAEVVNEMPALGRMRGGGLVLKNVTISQACEKMFGGVPYSLRSEKDVSGNSRVIIGFKFPKPKPAPKMPRAAPRAEMTKAEREKLYLEIGEKAVFKKADVKNLEVFPGYSREKLEERLKERSGSELTEFIPGMTKEEWSERSGTGVDLDKVEVMPGLSSHELDVLFKNGREKESVKRDGADNGTQGALTSPNKEELK